MFNEISILIYIFISTEHWFFLKKQRKEKENTYCVGTLKGRTDERVKTRFTEKEHFWGEVPFFHPTSQLFAIVFSNKLLILANDIYDNNITLKK